MKGIHTLIKMHQRQLDELRRRLVQLEEQKQQLIELATKLHHELMEERQLAAESPMMSSYMGDFEKRVAKRQLGIAQEVVKLDVEMQQLSAAIAESFGELKKYEITRDNDMAREQAKADLREQNMLDEVAIQQFTRKDDKK